MINEKKEKPSDGEFKTGPGISNFSSSSSFSTPSIFSSSSSWGAFDPSSNHLNPADEKTILVLKTRLEQLQKFSSHQIKFFFQLSDQSARPTIDLCTPFNSMKEFLHHNQEIFNSVRHVYRGEIGSLVNAIKGADEIVRHYSSRILQKFNELYNKINGQYSNQNESISIRETASIEWLKVLIESASLIEDSTEKRDIKRLLSDKLGSIEKEKAARQLPQMLELKNKPTTNTVDYSEKTYASSFESTQKATLAAATSGFLAKKPQTQTFLAETVELQSSNSSSTSSISLEPISQGPS